MRVLLFVNPQSRRGKQLAGDVRRALQAQGIEIAAPHSPGSVDAVVVGGGDGTLARHVARALRLDVPVGLIPLGTFNELARTLDIPLDVEGACRTIAAGNTRRIDVATVNGAYYVNEASVGLSSRLTRLQRPADKQRFGFWAVAASALAAFRYLRPFRARIEYEGGSVEVRTFQLTVANSHRFGGFITAQDAAIDDGRLDLYAIEAQGLLPLWSALRAILAHHWDSGAGLRVYRSASFSILTRRPHRITADGEPAGRTPAEFMLLPKALQVFVPEKIS
ncbi:MAG TPA: YegS/Rv2252/BmrU family lipid kinase [Candidatus Cybelea sp.]|jgi:YegS/Rv2252/BmrU family lipid kinase